MQSVIVSSVLLHLCTAQVFPFSNLRAFFEPKNKQVGVSSSAANVSRPLRQAEREDNLPALSEFDSPDVFTINREVKDNGGETTKRYPSSSVTSGRKGSRHRVNSHSHVRDPPEEDGSIFITPKPNHHTEYESSEDYSKVRSKNRIRKRKPQTVQVEPEVQQSEHVVSDQIRIGGFTESKNPPSNSFTSEGTYVESIPSLAVTIEDDLQKRKSNNDLIDYLVPPKHPSVYEKALKLTKTRKILVPIAKLKTLPTPLSKMKSPPPAMLSKLKSPTPTGLSKLKSSVPPALLSSETRFRPQNPSVPLSERATKRHVRRRPHPRDPQRMPARKPPVEALMDEQITSETGFTGAGAVHGGSHGDERVEFQMHGQKGPNSYKFGYDTGKGHNRQFRFEEKDNHGRVRGHYGYYDKDGKLQVVNYEADPHTGFKAETV